MKYLGENFDVVPMNPDGSQVNDVLSGQVLRERLRAAAAHINNSHEGISRFEGCDDPALQLLKVVEEWSE